MDTYTKIFGGGQEPPLTSPLNPPLYSIHMVIGSSYNITRKNGEHDVSFSYLYIQVHVSLICADQENTTGVIGSYPM